MGRQAAADRSGVGGRVRGRRAGGQSRRHPALSSGGGWRRRGGGWRAAPDDRRCLGVDAQPLHPISTVSRGVGCDRRVQRQIHVQPDGAAGWGGGDPDRAHARYLSQLLPAFGALGVFRFASRGGRLMPDGSPFVFHDLAPGEDSFRDAVLAGLSANPKSLPCKFFYDARGSALFEAICEVPEYYLTRTEIGILRAYAPTIAARIGPNCRLVELGSGASIKVRLLLEALEAPLAYVPVDISRGFLRDAAASVAADFPALDVIAVCADYTRPFNLPRIAGPAGKTLGFFPGSTIGNFEPEGVVAFLSHCR